MRGGEVAQPNAYRCDQCGKTARPSETFRETWYFIEGATYGRTPTFAVFCGAKCLAAYTQEMARLEETTVVVEGGL
jgi:hypothetical protein